MNYFSRVIAIVMAVLMITTTSAFAFSKGSAGLPSGFVGLGVEMSDVELNAVEGEGWGVVIALLKYVVAPAVAVLIGNYLWDKFGGKDNIETARFVSINKMNVYVEDMSLCEYTEVEYLNFTFKACPS